MSKSQVFRASLVLTLLWTACQPTSSVDLDRRGPVPSVAIADPVASLPTYRIGVLGAATTDNFWAAQDIAASVWNSYVLASTKPSLYMTKYPGLEVGAELADTTALPQPRASGDRWVVSVPIRPDAEWSDGEPITAGDVVFTFETVRDLGLGGGWIVGYPVPNPSAPTQIGLTEVRAAGERTVEFWFNQRPGLSVWPHGVGMAPIMPAHHWQKAVTQAARSADPVKTIYQWAGTGDPSGGPMILDEFVAGSHVHSVANLNYFGRSDEVTSGGVEFERGPFIGDAFFVLYSTQDSAVMALQAGEIDFILTPLGIAPALVDHARTDQSLASVTNDTNGFRYLAFNLRRFPMILSEFRDSLALMVDKEFVADQVLQGAAVPRYTSIPRSNQIWWNESVATEIASEYAGRSLTDRVTAAVTLLKRAGFSWEQEPGVNADGTAVLGGSPISYQGSLVGPLEILAPSAGYDPLRATYAIWIENWLDQLGFAAEANPTDLDSLVRQVFVPVDRQLDYDMFILGWGLGDPAWPTHYENFWSTRHDTIASGGHNMTGFSDQRFDELVDRFSATIDLGEAYELAWQMEGIVAKEKPYLILFDAGITELYREATVEYPFLDTLAGLQNLSGMQALVQGAK